MTGLDRMHSVGDLCNRARSRLPKGLFEYIDGGAEDEITLARNTHDFRRNGVHAPNGNLDTGPCNEKDGAGNDAVHCIQWIRGARRRNLAARGWRVIASMRDTTNAANLCELAAAAGADSDAIDVIELDVTSEEFRASAVKSVVGVTPDGLTTVLHCADYTTAGSFEYLPPANVRSLFETNFLGAVDITQ
ncbi:SDR family oxidoreductase [Rhodococcus sp. WS4]|nr:SDR family oxidoreductase [Rhodococcus sp. WS4]